MSRRTSIVCFRQDLRLQDNPAQTAAARRDGPVIPVFIWAPRDEGGWSPGAASRWWLHHSLRHLQAALQRHGSQPIVRRGTGRTALQALIRETGADGVFWNQRYEPAVARGERTLLTTLRAKGITAERFHAGLPHDPSRVHRREGKPFQMFTPFWKACLAGPNPLLPFPAPDELRSPTRWPPLPIDGLRLEPTRDWAGGLREAWTPGEAGAWEQLERAPDEVLAHYPATRDRPDLRGASRLSPGNGPPSGSGILSSMPTSPTIPWAGSGPLAAAPALPPTSGSSIPCARERSSTRTGITSAAGCRNCDISPMPGSINPGRRHHRSARRQESC